MSQMDPNDPQSVERQKYTIIALDAFLILFPLIFHSIITSTLSIFLIIVFIGILVMNIYEIYKGQPYSLSPAIMSQPYDIITDILFVITWLYTGYITMVILYILSKVIMDIRKIKQSS